MLTLTKAERVCYYEINTCKYTFLRLQSSLCPKNTHTYQMQRARKGIMYTPPVRRDDGLLYGYLPKR